MLKKTIPLSNGHTLGYAEYGDLQGSPLFFFHGQPGNRLFRHPDESLTASAGVRLITMDRPGYGRSDFQPGRKLSDWPKDVVALADTLSIERFAVLGFSGGGPYALACAMQIPHRLTCAGIADSAPPMYLPQIHRTAPRPLRANYWLAHYAPIVLEIMFKGYWIYSRRNPDSFLKMALGQSPQADQAILSQPCFYKVLEEVWKENLRCDSRGYVQDAVILMSEWGFRMSDIQKEIYLWQGGVDANTPAFWAQYFVKELPCCKATYYPDEGHFVIFSHWKEILQQLAMPV